MSPLDLLWVLSALELPAVVALLTVVARHGH